MIIAGAGSGKTTTIAGKVKYLVDIKNIKPEEIIIISFTNKAVLELKQRINFDFKINSKICTFHKFGMDILNDKRLKVLSNTYDSHFSFHRQYGCENWSFITSFRKNRQNRAQLCISISFLRSFAHLPVKTPYTGFSCLRSEQPPSCAWRASYASA